MLILPAYAKVNLALEVTGRRDDGLHDVRSLLVRLDWHDLVAVDARPAAERDIRVRVTGTRASHAPEDGTNLAHRAAGALLDAAGVAMRVDIWLDKRVPAGAGLGGGSADAAAVLRALQTVVCVDDETVRNCAAALGSDVPAMVQHRAQDVRGRGEQLEPVVVPALQLVVVPTVHGDTRTAYGALHPAELRDDGRVDRLRDALRRGVVDDSLLGSALEPAASRASPSLAAAVRRVRHHSPSLTWHMTGSGGALFTVVPRADLAADLAHVLRRDGFDARACRTTASAA